MPKNCPNCNGTRFVEQSFEIPVAAPRQGAIVPVIAVKAYTCQECQYLLLFEK
jgi:hypothetical protein